MVWVPAGTFLMGSDRHYPEETPAHRVAVDGFWMDRYAVTNAEFARFVDATGYVTLAERPARPEDYPGAAPEMLAPSSVVFRKSSGPVDLRNPYNWWTYVPGADWRHPHGPESTHPRSRQRIPWCRSRTRTSRPTPPGPGRISRPKPNGSTRRAAASTAPSSSGATSSRPAAGAWPTPGRASSRGRISLEDGFEGTAPVGSFPPNGYGLYDMAGNVWELTTDWYQEHEQLEHACCSIGRAFGTIENPRGAEREQSFDPRTPGVQIPRKVMKGGSYLCAPNYCQRYRPAARMPQPLDTATCHVGFRCIVRPR